MKKEHIVHTLAQSVTQDPERLIINRATGSDDKGKLWKRARAKHFGNYIVFRQIDGVPESYLTKGYWNTYHCSNKLIEDPSENKIKSIYCKHRWCPVCSRIRTAQNIHRYYDIISEWESPYFVTLTRPNVKDIMLDQEVGLLIKQFSKIRNRIKVNRHRNKKDNFAGIRKLEITYNHKNDTYHPHFHIIVRSKEDAQNLMHEWLKDNKSANRIAQDYRPADKNSILELFKYVTKMVYRDHRDKIILYPPVVLDNIFMSLRGRRTFQNFGFKGKAEINPDKITKEDYEKADIILWEWENNDWINSNGELLTNYEPSENIKNIIDNSNSNV